MDRTLIYGLRSGTVGMQIVRLPGDVSPKPTPAA